MLNLCKNILTLVVLHLCVAIIFVILWLFYDPDVCGLLCPLHSLSHIFYFWHFETIGSLLCQFAIFLLGLLCV